MSSCSKSKKANCKDPCEWIVGKGCRDNQVVKTLTKKTKTQTCSKSKKADCKDPCEWIVGKGCR